MREQTYVNILGEWCKLEADDYFQDLQFGERLTSRTLNGLEDDFFKVTYKGKKYFLHKSHFMFIRE